MGSVVPIIYCKREEIGDVDLWRATGKHQPAVVTGTQCGWRAVFPWHLPGRGSPIEPIEERRQMALGNNTLASYELRKRTQKQDASPPISKNGGRIDEDDYELWVSSLRMTIVQF